MAQTNVTVLVNGSAGRLEGEGLTSDDAGRFQLMFRVGDHTPPFTFEIRERGAHPPIGLVRQLRELAAGRTTDLGDLPMAELGLVARGVVRDDLGRPLAKATVKLQRERESSVRGRGAQWADEAFVVAQSDAQGRFELFGTLLSGRYRLAARARDHLPAQSAEVFGGNEIDITLTRTGEFVATMLVPAWLPNEAIRVRIESASDPNVRWSEHPRDANGKKLIAMPWVRPGVYGVTIEVAGVPAPILRIGGVRINAGQRDVHPRLIDLDLTSPLYGIDPERVRAGLEQSERGW